MDGMGKRKRCRPHRVLLLCSQARLPTSHFPRLGCGGELWMLYRLLGDVNALLLVPAWSAAAFIAHLCSLGPAYPMPSRGCNYQKLNGKWISKVR